MTYEVYNIKTGEYITSTEYNNNYLDDFLTLQVVYVKYCYLKDDAIFKMYDYTHKYLTDTTIQFFCEKLHIFFSKCEKVFVQREKMLDIMKESSDSPYYGFYLVPKKNVVDADYYLVECNDLKIAFSDYKSAMEYCNKNNMNVNNIILKRWRR